MRKIRPERALNFLLLLLLAISVLFFTRTLFGLAISETAVKEAPAAKGAQAPAQVPQKTPELTEYASLTKNNVFGFPSSELKALGGEITGGEALPSAEVSLIGTVSGALGYAVILRDSKEEVYRVGESIPGVGKLASLRKNHAIILSPEGVSSKLPLKDLMMIKEGEGQPAASFQSSTQASPGEPRFAKETSKSSYVLDKTALDEALQNPSGILTHARLLPNFSAGRQQGFVVSEVKPRGVFDQLGIKNGDVLLRINQMEISGPDAALRAFAALKGMDRVELDIQRHGQKQTYTYEIR